MHRRPAHSKRNNRLNVMIAGSGGCGKSTLVNTLCGGREVASTTDWLDANPATAGEPRPLRLRTYTEDIADPELGNLTLRLVETVGLGDNLDNSGHIRDILRYIEGQYDEVLAEESRIKRNPRFTDNRVHCVVYMIEATGHGLREPDVEFMRRIGRVANIIPVLAKADGLTPTEVLVNKRLIHEDIERYEIPIFQFAGQEDAADSANEEEDEHAAAMRRLQDSLPFTVIGASGTVPLANSEKTALVRQYAWGVVHVEDTRVSEFPVLREILLYSHLQELRESTTDYLYERYRTQRLSQEPEFNAAVSAAGAPVTSSRANLAPLAAPLPPGFGVPSAGNGMRNGAMPGHGGTPVPQGQEYIQREDRLRQEEELLQRDEKLMQSELEVRRQELRRRELEIARLEERLRQESREIGRQVPPSHSLQKQLNDLRTE